MYGVGKNYMEIELKEEEKTNDKRPKTN